MSENETPLPFDKVTCSKCQNIKQRRSCGESPNGRRRYYQDEKGRAWRGKTCPDCATKEHTEYMRKYRQKNKKKISLEDYGLGPE